MLSKVMEDVDLGVPVENVDIDENMELAKKYGVRGVPMLALVEDDGTVVRTRSGMMMEAELVKFVKGE
jgi:thioredoxin-like negative regulator of GroEL